MPRTDRMKMALAAALLLATPILVALEVSRRVGKAKD
jgi:hypothetical protein